MGRNNGQGGWYGQGKQVQQGFPQPQGQGWFQNSPQQFPGGGTSYNPNARKHENFSYSNPKAAVQYPPGFDPGAKPPNNEGRPSTDEIHSNESTTKNHGVSNGAIGYNGGKHAKQREISFNHRAKPKRALQGN
ncbi:hypothetical protein ACS0TY_035196 [Phlomoides rotata]